ncbi:MAG: hypothetical protein PHR68_02830 [Candidatus Gracilibacteria bacterium]|nr:hypothetical protein [Candidatus Gracilibacteria bacterium]
MKTNKVKNSFTIKNQPSKISFTKTLETRLVSSKLDRKGKIFNTNSNNLEKWGIN